MRDKGLNALKYKVIILDEVHERSVESDLVLVCVKQFLLKKNDLRLGSITILVFASIVALFIAVIMAILSLLLEVWHLW